MGRTGYFDGPADDGVIARATVEGNHGAPENRWIRLGHRSSVLVTSRGCQPRTRPNDTTGTQISTGRRSGHREHPNERRAYWAATRLAASPGLGIGGGAVVCCHERP